METAEDGSPATISVERPSVKSCDNAHNVSTIVLIESGKADRLIFDESKQRFYEKMEEAEAQWVLRKYAKTPHGFALTESLGPPGHLHEDAGRRSTVSMPNLIRRVFPEVSQNRVAYNGSDASIPA